MESLYPVFLIVIGATWVCGWCVGYRLAKGSGVRERAGAWALACIVPTGGLIIAAHLTALAAMLTGRGWFTPATVAAVFALLCWGGRHLLRVQLSGSPQMIRPSLAWPGPLRLGYWWLPVLIIIGMYAVFLVDALTSYPTGHDTMHYHLPSAIRWMQQRSMNLTAGVPVQSMHENGMIVPALLAFAKLERLFPLVHLPKGLLVAVTIYGLARAIGVGALGSIVAACVAMSVPMVVFQSFSGYVDLYAAASWLSALLALVWAMRAVHDRQRRTLLILAGLSAGVALGARTLYLVMIAMLAVVVLAEGWIRPQAQRTLAPRPVRNAVTFCVATLACSGFWFVRGAIHTGNPIYPVGVTIGGKQLLPGVNFRGKFPQRSVAKKIRRWWDYPWREPKHSGVGPNPGYPYSRNNAVGAAYAAFVPLGMLAVTLGSIARRPHSQEEKWRVVFLLIAASAIVLVPTVFLEMLRYALPQILIAIPVAAVLVDRLIARFPRSTLIMLTIALLVTAAIATLKPAHSFLGRVRDHRWDRAWFYQIPPLIDELEPGARVLNLGAPSATYTLLGRNLNNVVVTPSHWKVLLGDKPICARTLREHAIDYIFLHEPWPNDWPDDLPVELIYDGAETRTLRTSPAARIYRVKRLGFGADNRDGKPAKR